MALQLEAARDSAAHVVGPGLQLEAALPRDTARGPFLRCLVVQPFDIALPRCLQTELRVRALLTAGVRGDALHDQCKNWTYGRSGPVRRRLRELAPEELGAATACPNMFIAYLGKVWYRTVWYLPVRIAARPQQSSERSPSPARLLRGIGAVP